MWFKVDDGFQQSRKVVGIPRAKRPAAIGVWLLAGTWCARNLTDGVIADHEFIELGFKHADAEHLVRVGLWVREEGGYRFHNWEKYQPTREQVLEMRRKDADRKAAARAKGAAKAVEKASVRADKMRTPDGIPEESALPVPSRPVPTTIDIDYVPASVTDVDARAHQIDPEVIEWATSAGIRDIAALQRLVEQHLGCVVDAATLIDVVSTVCKQARAHVIDVDAYFATAVRQTPHTVFAALGISRSDADAALAAVAAQLAGGGLR